MREEEIKKQDKKHRQQIIGITLIGLIAVFFIGGFLNNGEDTININKKILPITEKTPENNIENTPTTEKQEEQKKIETLTVESRRIKQIEEIKEASSFEDFKSQVKKNLQEQI